MFLLLSSAGPPPRSPHVQAHRLLRPAPVEPAPDAPRLRPAVPVRRGPERGPQAEEAKAAPGRTLLPAEQEEEEEGEGGQAQEQAQQGQKGGGGGGSVLDVLDRIVSIRSTHHQCVTVESIRKPRHMNVHCAGEKKSLHC